MHISHDIVRYRTISYDTDFFYERWAPPTCDIVRYYAVDIWQCGVQYRAISYDIVHAIVRYRTISYDIVRYRTRCTWMHLDARDLVAASENIRCPRMSSEVTQNIVRYRTISHDIAPLIFGSVGYNIVRYRTILYTISYEMHLDALGCTRFGCCIGGHPMSSDVLGGHPKYRTNLTWIWVRRVADRSLTGWGEALV